MGNTKTSKASEAPIEKISEFVATFFINMGGQLEHLKLQKLLYYIQGWHLVYFSNHPLFLDEPQAWVNGPVYQKIYDKYWGQNTIVNPTIPKGNTSEEYFNSLLNELKLSVDQQELIFSVLNKYGKMETLTLVHKTHNETPWINARKGVAPFARSTNKITHESMRTYFASLIPE